MASSSPIIISKQIQYIIIVVTEPQQTDFPWWPGPARGTEPSVAADDRTDLAEEDMLLPLADLDLRLVELEGQLAGLNPRRRLEALESRVTDLNTRLLLTPLQESVNTSFKRAAEETAVLRQACERLRKDLRTVQQTLQEEPKARLDQAGFEELRRQITAELEEDIGRFVGEAAADAFVCRTEFVKLQDHVQDLTGTLADRLEELRRQVIAKMEEDLERFTGVTGELPMAKLISEFVHRTEFAKFQEYAQDQMGSLTGTMERSYQEIFSLMNQVTSGTLRSIADIREDNAKQFQAFADLLSQKDSLDSKMD